ncbi:hypothetical protein [Membranihabitans marinus]|uniref:hypothetical protein n=1 Tax=Membranihabitans marinus TaxID=1227546 RepID=UPI001F2FE821|nr:hypothetical protein [Membranihabitans marinus]
MNFLEYSLHWVKGEILEGWIILISGLITLFCSFCLWYFGTTANAKSLILPMIVVGTLFLAMASSMVYSNNKRLPAMQQSYQENPMQFAQNEKKRVEDFQILYPISLAVSTVCFILTLIFFWFTNNQTLYAVGIPLSIFGIALIVIDYFSKERASIYYEQILNYLK